jgi:hypothetical protein
MCVTPSRPGPTRSRRRAFQDSPQALAGILKRRVPSFDALARAGQGPALIWYEDLVGNPHAARLDGSGLDAVMFNDAQAGTTLCQQATAARRLPEGLLQEFDAAWARIAARDLLSAPGMQRLLPEA